MPKLAPELEALLARPLIAVVGTAGAQGKPHAVPVWFHFDGEAIEIWADTGRVWVKNLLRDPRYTVTIAEHEAPFAAVLVRGEVTVTAGDRVAVHAAARRISPRYLPATEVDAYVEQWSDLDAFVRVPMTTVSGWGRGY